MPSTNNDQPLRIIPLGGVGEIGKNMYVFEYRDEIVVIDCGLMFPDEEMFGIDLVIPDITYLKERRANVKAFLITHAHEDHVGALPYVLPEFPGVPVYASTLARGLLGNKIKEHKLHNNPLIALEPGRRDRHRRLPRHAVPGRSLDPGRDGDRPADPDRDDRPHRRLQVRPHAGRRQAVRLRDPGQARCRGRALPAVGLDTGREPRLHAVRADGRRGLPRDHGAARGPGHRRDLRQQHRARPAGPRRGRRHEPQRLGHRPLDGAELPDRDRSRLPQVRRVEDRAQGQDQGPSRRQARHRHDRRPGRADGRSGADGQPRPPLRRDPAGRHGHRQRQPDPGQRGIGLAHDRQPVQGRRQRLLPHDQARPRLGPRQPGRAQADARADQAEALHPDARRVPDAGPARPPGDRDRRRPGERVHHRERDADRVLRRRLGTARHTGRRRATSTSTGCRSAMSATSSCATGAPSPTTGCS